MPLTDSKRRRGGSSDVEEVGTREILEALRLEVAGISKALSTLTVTVETMNKKMDRQEEVIGEINERLAKQGEEMVELRGRVEDEARAKESLAREVRGWRERVERLEEKMLDQECRSRRNNLVVFGVKESEEEDGRKLMEEVARKCQVERSVKNKRAHRLGRKGPNMDRPRPLIARFLDYQDRERIWRGKKHLPSEIRVVEDHPFPVREARRKLVPELVAAKQAGRQAWIAFPARLLVDGREVRAIKPGTGERSEGAQP